MWIAALNKLAQDEVKHGVAAIIEQRITWPPSLAKFIDLCDKNKVDAGEAFDRFIRRDPCHGIAEKVTRQNVGYRCRNQLSEDRARKLFADELKKNLKLEREGRLRDPDVKLIAAYTQETEWDRKLRERIESGKDPVRGKK